MLNGLSAGMGADLGWARNFGMNYVSLLPIMIMYVWTSSVFGKLFIKSGRDERLALVPIVRIWVLFDIVYGRGWMSLLLLVPLVQVIVYISFHIRLAQVFGCKHVVGLLAAFLPFLNFILILMPVFATYYAINKKCRYLGVCKDLL